MKSSRHDIMKMIYDYTFELSKNSPLLLCKDSLHSFYDKLYVQENDGYTLICDNVKYVYTCKTCVAVLCGDCRLLILNKETGELLKEVNNVYSVNKRNVYSDRYTSLVVSYNNTCTTYSIIIIDNKECNVIGAYDDVIEYKRDDYGDIQLGFKLYNGKKYVLTEKGNIITLQDNLNNLGYTITNDGGSYKLHYKKDGVLWSSYCNKFGMGAKVFREQRL